MRIAVGSCFHEKVQNCSRFWSETLQEDMAQQNTVLVQSLATIVPLSSHVFVSFFSHYVSHFLSSLEAFQARHVLVKDLAKAAQVPVV